MAIVTPKVKPKRITIGRRDIANLPDLNLKDIAIKIDTGAYTSAIHCRDIQMKTVRGKEVISFKLLDPDHPQFNGKVYSTNDFYQKWIKNSFGASEQRYVIKTSINLFGKKYPIELSLSERGEMKYPVLIGRKFLMKRFVVDPARYDLSFKQRTGKKITNPVTLKK